MRLVLRTNEPILLGYAEAILRSFGLEPVLADVHMSALEGSIGLLPRRLLVPAEYLVQARRVLTDAGLGEWIVADDEA